MWSKPSLQGETAHTQPSTVLVLLHADVSLPSYLDTQSPVHKNGKMSVPPNPPPLASLAPAADSSTRVDSPSHGLVTSSLCSPAAAGVPHTSTSQPSRPSACKVRARRLFFLTRFLSLPCENSASSHSLSPPVADSAFFPADERGHTVRPRGDHRALGLRLAATLAPCLQC